MDYLGNCITDLFHLGLKQDEILLFLTKHRYYLSKSSLKRYLKRLNLYRRKNFTSINDVISFFGITTSDIWKIAWEELNNVVLEWNTHLIRKNRHSHCPSGRPDVIFNFPQIHNSNDHLIVVQEEHLQTCEEECVFLDCPCSDNDVFDLCKIILEELGSDKPTDPLDAISLYKEIRNEILTLL
ncbi:hypothetical protein NQ315_016213 [Exocentrus adspersus]|uniref:Uncharacterized protein n=1 Tax=Exocentrus adspersus TaxID=1586481 RepID=A0AAV8VJF7_9CUCU|nr:hypothetical protein NQ315_016213 [Exocentrus adspersus]